jgi:hypothetical protein
MNDKDFTEILQRKIDESLGRRVKDVEKWVEINLHQFSMENQDIKSIQGRLKESVRAMSAAVQLCASGCSKCNFKCRRLKQHLGDHHCGTDHYCKTHHCEAVEDHVLQIPCGLLYVLRPMF